MQLHTANELAKRLRNMADAEELAVYARHANGPAKLAVGKSRLGRWG